MRGARTSERQGRLIDSDEAASMEQEKARGISDARRSDPDAACGRRERQLLLRFLTCGSVDDGKSTLIGRLLYDADV